MLNEFIRFLNGIKHACERDKDGKVRRVGVYVMIDDEGVWGLVRIRTVCIRGDDTVFFEFHLTRHDIEHAEKDWTGFYIKWIKEVETNINAQLRNRKRSRKP